MKIRIENDLFEIAKRLKTIDSGYIVVFNTKKHRYEVRHSALGDKICFVVPYTILDERTLKYARKTSIQYSQKLLEEIERNNEEIERKNQNKLKDQCDYKFREIFNYEKKSKEMDLKKSYKTKWI